MPFVLWIVRSKSSPTRCGSKWPCILLPGGGYSWEFLVGVYPDADPISDLKMSFFTPVFRPGLQNPYPFSDLASKKLCRHYLDWNTNKNNFSIYTFLFLSYSFGIERINTFIHSRSSLENDTRFQNQNIMGKVSTCF